MGLIYRLSLRNLLRQKKRNLLLGIGIAFGMMILVVANSFSHGMVDVLIKDIVSNAFGHLVVQASQGNSSYTMIRDKERIMQVVKANIKSEDLVGVGENLGMFCQAVGNGASDNIMVVGVSVQSAKERKEFFNDFFTLKQGNFDEYFSKNIEYPVIISEQTAKSLNVKVHDAIKIRLPMVTGQLQTAQLVVVAIANANNSFMNVVAFMDGDRVKSLLGYKPWESASLHITLKDPARTAKKYADILHEKLQPGLLSISGNVNHQACPLFAFKNDEASKSVLRRNIRIVSGDADLAFSKDGVLIPLGLARKLNLRPGDSFSYEYPTKYRGLYQENLKVSAIYDSSTKLGSDLILVNGERIYDTYDKYLPQTAAVDPVSPKDPLHAVLATEWKLLPRCKDSTELQKLSKEERRIKTDQSKFSVVTMYEGASDILNLEGVLNLITVIAVMVLFFIILIGVINTLRMTVRERTREIGTIRAIGMQKNDVRNLFIMETLQLTAISCVAGFVLGLGVMWILGSITFNTDSALSMILKNKHLFFKLDPVGLVTNFLLIMVIAGVTAYFPARRAAKLSAMEALRHYE